MVERIKPFYPRNTQLVKEAHLIVADGYVADGDSGRPFEGIQIGSRNRKTGRRTLFSGIKQYPLIGVREYESHLQKYKKNGQRVEDTRRGGLWISKDDYDRLTQK